MSKVRRLARPLLSVAFITGGVDKIRHPDDHADTVAPMLEKVGGRLDSSGHVESLDPTLVVRVAGGAQIGAGLLFAAGLFPRCSAAVLTTASAMDTASKPFWKIRDKDERKRARSRMVANMSLLGGAMLASVDTAGKPSLAWRAQHASVSARKVADQQSKNLEKRVKKAAKKRKSGDA